jgi:hypothetical protein
VAETELISAVIPARNAAATIAHTLDCLLAQSEPRWHAYLVDDGSIDDTGAIMAKYAARDARFSVLAGHRAGVSRARNVALPFARGRWLHFLDSDDWVTPDFYEKMLARIATTPDAIACYCGYRRVMPDGGMTWPVFKPEIAESALEVFARYCGLHIAGLLLDRGAVQLVGGFDPALTTCEDLDLFQRIARLAGAWVGLNEPLAFYRTGAASLSRNTVQLEADLRTVIARGFGVDNRLAGLKLAHPDGAVDSGGEVAFSIAKVVLWAAAQRCRPNTGTALDERIFRPLTMRRPEELYLADVLIEGLVLGERVTADKLAALWPRYADGVTHLISLLGKAWEDAGVAHALQFGLEERILDFDGLSIPRLLGRTAGLRLNIYKPAPIQLPAKVERVYAYIMRGKHFRGIMRLPVNGEVTRRRWLESILLQSQRDGTFRGKDVALLRCLLMLDAAMAFAWRLLPLCKRGLLGLRTEKRLG